MAEVRNVTFNPSWPGGLEGTLVHLGDQGFGLVRIVPMGAYEAVAVFARPADEPQETEEPRPVEGFTARYEVTFEVADRHATASMMVPHTPENLESWLRSLVCNSPRQGVKPSVKWIGDDLEPF